MQRATWARGGEAPAAWLRAVAWIGNSLTWPRGLVTSETDSGATWLPPRLRKPRPHPQCPHLHIIHSAQSRTPLPTFWPRRPLAVGGGGAPEQAPVPWIGRRDRAGGREVRQGLLSILASKTAQSYGPRTSESQGGPRRPKRVALQGRKDSGGPAARIFSPPVLCMPPEG